MGETSARVVKGIIGTDERRPRRGYPDQTNVATNRRWVTAGTPAIFRS